MVAAVIQAALGMMALMVAAVKEAQTAVKIIHQIMEALHPLLIHREKALLLIATEMIMVEIRAMLLLQAPHLLVVTAARMAFQAQVEREEKVPAAALPMLAL
jgi:hypothetical protein